MTEWSSNWGAWAVHWALIPFGFSVLSIVVFFAHTRFRKLRATVRNLESQLHRSYTDNSALQQHNESLSAEINRVHGELDRQRTDNESLSAEINRVHGELDGQRTDLVDVKTHREQLVSENATLREQARLLNEKFVNREDAISFVSALYTGILRRQPDAHEYCSLVDSLLNGRTYASLAQEFISSEEFRHYTAVRLFVAPGHFYSPVVDPVEASSHIAAIEAKRKPDSLPGIAINRARMVGTWHNLLPFLTTVPFPETPTPGFLYAFDNPSYSYGDASVLHAILRLYRPKRVIEVGSGWSSACIFDTVQNYLGDSCEMTFIEPHPEVLENILGDAAFRARLLKTSVQQVPLEVFQALKAHDILFIDSTHVLRTGSDVCFELFEILPRLASGVLVHIHDIFWPFEYPRLWAVDENRSWNELYALRAFLTNNNDWDIIMFNDYLTRFERTLIEATYPQFLRNSGAALWLQRRAPNAQTTMATGKTKRSATLRTGGRPRSPNGGRKRRRM